MGGALPLCEENEEVGWRCRKHPWQPGYGVCPSCLRDRLLRLCPVCASYRPCACLPSPSSSNSSSTSFSSLSSSADLPRASIGAVGRVSYLIDSEPAFRRTRSAAFAFLRPRSEAPGGDVGSDPVALRARGWAALWWPFSKVAAAAKREAAEVKMGRSRSAGVESYPESGGGGGEARSKGWGWYFPSPLKAFKHRKSAKIVHERSPMHH